MAHELPTGTGKIVVVVGGAFLACLGVFLCVAVANGPSGSGATIGPPDPPGSVRSPSPLPPPAPTTATEPPCYLYLTEGNVLGLSPSMDRIPTFISRDALLTYAEARLAKSEPGAVEALQGLASLERRGTKVDVVRFDLVSMQIVSSKGRAWIHPTWCHDAPAR